MSYLNVWVGVPDDRLAEWDDPDVQPVQDQTPRNLYRDDVQGPRTWTLRTVYVVDEPGWQGKLLQGFPTLRLLGAWRQDGELVIPLHPRIMEFLPDDVTYDQDGNEVSRVRPTEMKDVNLGMGWAHREWTPRQNNG